MEHHLSFWDDHKKRRGVYFIPEYVQVTGDKNSAILLCQLLYWFKPHGDGKSKLTIERDGKSWIAKSREELMKECGLTLNEYRAASKQLVGLGIVQREIHLFQRRTRSYLHLDVGELEKLLPVGLNPPLWGGEIHPSGEVKFTLPLTEAETTAETTADDLANEFATAPADKHLPTSLQEEQKLGDVIQMPTAKEILKNFQTSRQEKLAGAKHGAAWLAVRWKQLLGEEGGEFVKALTAQQTGQLKQLMQSVGPEKAKEILDFVIPHWGAFAFEVKGAYGLTSVPEKPVVGFLLKYHDVAVHLSAKPKTPVVHPTLPVAKPAAMPQVAPEEKVSTEAVQAALAKLNGG